MVSEVHVVAGGVEALDDDSDDVGGDFVNGCVVVVAADVVDGGPAAVGEEVVGHAEVWETG